MTPRKSKRVTEYWGERCDEYEPLCACCVAWRLLDETGKPPNYRAVTARLDNHFLTQKSTADIPKRLNTKRG
jgi:hypothetical protein